MLETAGSFPAVSLSQQLKTPDLKSDRGDRLQDLSLQCQSIAPAPDLKSDRGDRLQDLSLQCQSIAPDLKRAGASDYRTFPCSVSQVAEDCSPPPPFPDHQYFLHADVGLEMYGSCTVCFLIQLQWYQTREYFFGFSVCLRTTGQNELNFGDKIHRYHPQSQSCQKKIFKASVVQNYQAL